jgi:hypothetical protein
MYLNLPHILTITSFLATTLAAPMFPEGTCGPEEDLACYPDGSNGKRSADPEPVPMFPEGTCGPKEDLACYPDGSNGKRSSLTGPHLPSITASKVTIPPLGAPTGFDGGGYLRLRRSPPTSNAKPASIVIGSKPKPKRAPTPSPEEPEDPPSEDVGAYDEEKRSLPLSLDAAGHPILTGDNYPSVEDKRTLPPGLDRYNYPIEKRERPVDAADYPAERKREAIPSPSPLKKIEIDGDYPIPDDSSYPVRERAKRMRKLDVGDYEPPTDDGVYGPDDE